MTTPQPRQQHQTPSSAPKGANSGPSGDQDIDTAGTEANLLSDNPLTRFLLATFEREVERSRRALQRLPDDQADWKPHDRSMAFGYLSNMVATIPSWIAMIVRKDEIDIAPKDGSTMQQDIAPSSAAFLKALDATAADARAALEGTTDDHLRTGWQLKAGGQVVQESSRLDMLQDTLSHWSHHRGQMTVYLRLMGAQVPALFGPSADDAAW